VPDSQPEAKVLSVQGRPGNASLPYAYMSTNALGFPRRNQVRIANGATTCRFNLDIRSIGDNIIASNPIHRLLIVNLRIGRCTTTIQVHFDQLKNVADSASNRRYWLYRTLRCQVTSLTWPPRSHDRSQSSQQEEMQATSRSSNPVPREAHLFRS
jgi:hypothetical protein